MKSKLFIVLVIAACLCLSACTERSTDNSQSSENIPPSVINDSQKSETKEEQAEQDQKPQQSAENPSTEEPTEEELIALLDRAMNDITHLATNDTADVLNDIFEGDIDCRYSDVDKRINIDGYDYQWTSRPYSDIVDYYSQSFTGEPLEWILASRFADVDGVLYCFVGGGATGYGAKVTAVEKLEGNTYKGTCLLYYEPTGVEHDVIFDVEKTDAGYRISNIDYRSYLGDFGPGAKKAYSNGISEDEEKAKECIKLLDPLLLQEWEKPEDIQPMNFVMWYGYKTQSLLTSENYCIDGRDGLFFPEEEFEAEIKKYFDVSVEYLRSDSSVYLKDEHLYQTPAALYPLVERTYDITNISFHGSVFHIEFTLNYVEQKAFKEMILTLEKVDEGVHFLSYTSKS